MRSIMPMFLLWMILSGFFAPALARNERIRIGATVSASGHFASEIGPFEKLFRSWVDHLNKRGGIFLKERGRKLPLEIVIYDDQSQVPVVTRYYERLIQKDKVDFLIGPYSSPLTYAATIPAEKSKTPFLAICANSPNIYNRGFQSLVGVLDLAQRYTYRYWEMIRAERKAKSVSFVVEDSMHPRGVYKGSSILAESAGLKVRLAEIVPPDLQDFTGVILRLKRVGADIVYVSSNIPFSIAFMKQARERGLKANEFHCIHHGGVFKKALGSLAEGVVGQSYWSPGMGIVGEKIFLGLLKVSGINAEDYPWAPAYMCAFQIVTSAFERAGSKDKKTVMKALKEGSFETLCGADYFHKTGYGRINTYPSQVLKGKYEIVWPAERATARHLYPFSVEK